MDARFSMYIRIVLLNWTLELISMDIQSFAKKFSQTLVRLADQAVFLLSFQRMINMGLIPGDKIEKVCRSA